ncbi:DUF4166 domain-containing protein [Azospirillum sp. YIM B02556]|uniref:DUF4166 domain-containing protein n=1 Tax=Azospirillum endophyticum TaxID=2800326 RepID=A0ABS1F4P7_9PROT|nr:DUF4166 domain-containing protein [Azospirillum endophyticum]MBK1838383.1 DUF4166 domain-containing protein [Azospirillum endophyticum]
MTPFQRILGPDFQDLPTPVRDFHGLSASIRTAGLAEVSAPANPGVWLLGKIAGLPRPGRDVPVSVSFHPRADGREFWERRFAGRRYASAMEAGSGRDAGLLIEHFGPFDLLFRLTPGPGRLSWSLAGWRLLGLPLPAWSRPVIECSESGDGDRFVFDIDVVFPIVGPVVRYRGWLALADG